ncbi:Do family serine endopeptidase [Rhodoferax sp. U11-2br]|uniref:Do family serine endopeptidase n=1 Tax=Rhodoferax sp. U11-2br TaxID=2838878 RepID=UPI001BEB5C38|nr:Do family serine endopeptidase [Rhodoferax sp. U11-2br]MBT3068163.1 Do family serine endopeptidase [Rhodoferax sp. U11-2br]
MKKPFVASRVVLSLVLGGVLGGAAVTTFSLTHAQAASLVSSAPAVSTAVPNASMSLPDFSQIAQQHGPAVVNITVTSLKKVSNQGGGGAVRQRGFPGLDPDDPFYEFFRRFQGPGGLAGPDASPTPTRGEGSGFIVSADGLIMTNAHVVRDATEVMVKLTDRREFAAKVLGSDPKTDVAVIKIDAHNLPTVPLGQAKDLKVGEWVLAIGSPFGFENSVTAGVVSAKGRSLPDDSLVPFIQTDVAVNPGNSGGPLFNTRGEVVGINSQIYSQSGGYQGLSFAIPIELASKIKDQIVATGHASHARLGVAIQEVNQALADSFHLARPEGALVSSVDAGGPADKAGLQSGDVILKVNGQPIVASSDLPALIGAAAPGDKLELDIWRQGKPEHLSAKVSDASDKAENVAAAPGAAGQGRLGLALRALTPQEKRAAGVAAGLLVEDTTGPAALAGVQAGDVLLAVNGAPVQSLEQVRSQVAKSNKSVALLIARDGSRIFVPVRLG